MKLNDKSIATLPIVALILCLVLLGSDAGHVATRLRGVLFDAYQIAGPRTYVDTRARSGYSVRVLAVDAASLARFGPWPWPRSTLAVLLGELKEKGAALAVLAFPLDVPDPLSPKNLAAQTPAGPSGDAARAALETMVSPDVSLMTAMSHLATATGFVLGSAAAARSPVLKSPVTFIGAKDPFGHVPAFASASAAIAPLERMSVGTGAFNFTIDTDGTMRRNFDLPTTPDGSFWIHFSGKHPERDVSAAALDNGSIIGARLADAVVILAPPGETIATPLGSRTVADVYAEALENALTGSVLRRPAGASEGELICLALLGIAGIFLLVRFGVMWFGLFTAASVIAAFAISWQLYSANRLLFDPLGPGLALGLVFGAGAFARALSDARARGRVRTAFAQALPPSVVAQIARQPEILALEGSNRTVSYLCFGVHGLDALADTFKDDPAAFTRQMRRVLAALVEEVAARGGTLDRLAVDGFSAFWNAPLDDDEHAVHACEAASAMLEALAKTNDAIAQEKRDAGTGFTPIEIGVGISTGVAIAGGFNSHGMGSPVMRVSPKFRAMLTFHEHIFQSLRSRQWNKARELIEQCRKLSGASQRLYDLHLARIELFQKHPPGPEWDGAFRPIAE